MAIRRDDNKYTRLSLAQYNGQARNGEIVIDLDTYTVWVGDASGTLLPVGGGNIANSTIGNLIVTGTSNLGDIANITILGGTPGSVISTDGAGNLVWSPAIPTTYGNSNVTTLLASGNIATDIVTTANANVGNFNLSGIANLGDVGNVSILGGNNGQFLQTNGSGNLIWANASGGSANTGNITFANTTLSTAATLSNITLSTYDTANSITNNWVYGTDGNLTLPGGAGATSVSINFAGVGYTTATNVPTNALTGSGSGMTVDIIASLSGNNPITSVTINQAGTGYAPGDSIQVAQPSSTGNGTLIVNSVGSVIVPSINYANGQPYGGGSANVVSIPAIYFAAPATGNNQTFTNGNLALYPANTDITLFYNGALIENTGYTLSGSTLTVNFPINLGDSIDIIQTAVGNAASVYSNVTANAFLAAGQVGNVIPSGNAVYSLGNATNQWKDVWVSNATIYFNGVALSANTNTLTFAGEPLLISNGDSNIATTGSLDVGNVTATGNITANTGYFFIGDGGLLSNISGGGNSNYSNANVANYLPTYTGNLGNVDTLTAANAIYLGDTAFANSGGQYFYSNSSGTGFGFTAAGGIGVTTSGPISIGGTAGVNIFGVVGSGISIGGGTGGPISLLSNVNSNSNITVASGAFFIGDGGLLSNISTGTVYSNSNVAAYMPTYTGNLGNVTNITASGTITGNGVGLSNIAGANVTGQVGNALVSGTVYTNAQPNITSVGQLTSLGVTGNVTLGVGGFFIGDGGLLSNISGGGGGYGNGDVALYMPTYTGNLGNVDSITTTGNITVGTGSFIIGDGTYITNVPGAVAEAPFSIQTTSFLAVAGARYGVNTTSAAITATLPATPGVGQAIFFADAGGAYATNNLTVSPNGLTIMGDPSNMIVNTKNQNFGLFYNGTTWRTY